MAREQTTSAAEFQHLSDEFLAQLAKSRDRRGGAAKQHLVLRHQRSLCARVAFWHGASHFGAADVEDAKQQATIWVYHAIQHYDPGEGPEPRLFAPYLHCVVKNQVKKWRDRFYRQQKRRDYSVPLDDVPDRGVIDPIEILEARELQTRVRQAWRELDALDRQVCDEIADGRSIRELADQLGLTPKQARSIRGRVLSSLRVQIGKLWVGVNCG